MPKETEARVITAVHILTSGNAAQHPEHRFGTRKPQLWWVLFSRLWVEIPLTYVAIEHKDGLVLFDTGLDPAIESDPTYISQWIGRVLLKRIFRLEIGPDEALDRKLARIGLNAHDVKKAVISHLHFDHMGGIKHIPQADLIVSKREWDILSEPHPEREWILREHIEIEGARWRPISFVPTDDPALAAFGEAYDVMGDESMVLLPTPGHTPGSMSMLLRRTGMPPIQLAADLTYQTDLLMNDQTPGTGDARALKQSFAKVRALKEALPDLVILAAHDPGIFRALEAARSEA